ncbi:MAG: SDR family NAD(P)-dependent oxidoreductase [Candidatus Muiribacteriaceae bacterium]
MKKVIIIGASTGIGKALAYEFSANGWQVGITARRVDLLEKICDDIGNGSIYKKMDVSNTTEAMKTAQDLIDEMNGCDVFVISSAIGPLNPFLRWKRTEDTIDINVKGFAAMANVAFRYFRRCRKGQLVGISSTAALRGTGISPDYHASKAFMRNYLQSLRHQAFGMKLPIYVTEIMPGFVDTPLLKGIDRLVWVSPVDKAARQIYKAIIRKKKHAYITKRWRIVAWFLKYCPDWIYHRV